MSWLIGECLEVLDPEAAPKVLAFAREVTRRLSVEQLGFDLVELSGILSSGVPVSPNLFPEDMARGLEDMGIDLSKPEDIDSFISVNISGFSIWWSQFSGNLKGLDTMGIMREIVNQFPETPFIIGDGYYREYVKAGFREQLVKHTLDVGVDNPEALANLSAVLKEEQCPPFFLFPLGELLISKVDSAIEEVLTRVSALVPGEKLYCVLVDNETMEGDIYWKKGIVVDSHIVWQELTTEESRAIERTAKDIYQCYENKPDEAVFRCLFDYAYLNQISAQIAREDAEKAEQRSLEDDDCDLPL